MAGGGADTGSNAPDKAKKNRIDALIKCLLQLFGAKLNSFDESGKGHNGSFTGTTASGGNLSFVNDSTTFSKANLNNFFLGHESPKTGESDITGLTLVGKKWVGFGFPGGSGWIPFRTFSLATSYTANDLYGSAFWDNQIHELGHQIAQTQGLEKPGDEIYGAKVQDCVAKELVKH